MPTKSKSATTTKAASGGTKRRLPPIHPGEMLREEFMAPMGLSANALAMAIHVPSTRIGEIVNERRGISGDTAIRLGHYFHTSAQFWMNLQSHYDLECARDEFEYAVLKRIQPAARDESGEIKAVAA